MVKSVPLESKQARRTTFFKRKETIMKKTMELSTLCGVRACVICFAPDGKVETWPENPSQVKSILDVYRDHRKKKQLNKNLFSNWSDDWLRGLSLNSLNDLLGVMDSKLQNLETRIAELQNKGESGTAESLVYVDSTVMKSSDDACGRDIYDSLTFTVEGFGFTDDDFCWYNPMITVGDFGGSSESSLPLWPLNHCNGEMERNHHSLETRIAEFQNRGENGTTESLFYVDPTVINSSEEACGNYFYNPQTFTVGDFGGTEQM